MHEDLDLPLTGILGGLPHCRAVLSITTYYRPTSSPRWQPFPRRWVSTHRSLPQWLHPPLTRVPDTCSTQHIPCQPMFTLSCSHRPSQQGPTPHRSPRSMAASIPQGVYTPHTLSAQPKADHINILRNVHKSSFFWHSWCYFVVACILRSQNHTPVYFGCDFWQGLESGWF